MFAFLIVWCTQTISKPEKVSTASSRNDSSPQAFMHNSLPGCLVTSHSVSHTADSVNALHLPCSDCNLCVTDAVSPPSQCGSGSAHRWCVARGCRCMRSCDAGYVAGLAAMLGVLPLPQALCNSDEEVEWRNLRCKLRRLLRLGGRGTRGEWLCSRAASAAAAQTRSCLWRSTVNKHCTNASGVLQRESHSELLLSLQNSTFCCAPLGSTEVQASVERCRAV